ncbi:hypothetical protein EPN16_04930 [bacterium]|nr:MAG: hypothetical protein EPN16_04930 [bacterium]
MKKVILLILSFIVFFYPLALANIAAVPMRYTVLYNNDIRHGEENFWSNRLEGFFEKDIYLGSKEVTAKMIPFVEQRYSIDRHKRERTMAGVEFGVEPTEFLYIAEQFRYSWYSETLHRHELVERVGMPESLIRIILSHQLVPGKEILNGYAGSEYTYDFRNGRATRVEVVAGLLAALGKGWQASVDWRHRDRIHGFDSDTFEASVSYDF